MIKTKNHVVYSDKEVELVYSVSYVETGKDIRTLTKLMLLVRVLPDGTFETVVIDFDNPISDELLDDAINKLPEKLEKKVSKARADFEENVDIFEEG